MKFTIPCLTSFLLAAGGLPFLFMGIAALLAGNVTPALVCFAFTGGHAAFRRDNFQNARVFAGRPKILRPIGTDTGQVAPPRYSNPGTAREG